MSAGGENLLIVRLTSGFVTLMSSREKAALMAPSMIELPYSSCLWIKSGTISRLLYVCTTRTQFERRRLGSPSSQPNNMYNYPPDGSRNYSSPPDPNLLAEIEAQLVWYDDTAYLFPATRQLCEQITAQSGIDYDPLSTQPGLDTPYTQLYLILRQRLYEHEAAGGGEVVELQTPVGGINTIDIMVEQFNQQSIESATGGVLEGELEEELEGELEDEICDQVDGDEEDDGLFFE